MLLKVNRAAPPTGSVPTWESSRPKVAIIRLFTGDPPPSPAREAMPSVIRAKYSGGTKLQGELGQRRADRA